MRIGIITFHAVYNYGAVIQAYSLQKVLSDAGYNCEIINFSKEKQKDYLSLYSCKNGYKRTIKNLLLLPLHFKRKRRVNRFNDFICNEMNISEDRYKTDISLKNCIDDYDIFLIGSDQVWNTLKDADTSPAYFLDFVPENKIKIAYAPSLGSAQISDLTPYKQYLQQFSRISCREKGGAKTLATLLNRDVNVVLDPTLLIKANSFTSLISTIEVDRNRPYLLYYSLDGFDTHKRNMDILSFLAKKFNLSVKLITPEWPYHSDIGEDIIDAGPIEFLSLIKNAELICTNSFHGTALSIALQKNFYVLENVDSKDERKTSLLQQLGIEERILPNVVHAERVDNYVMNYNETKHKLESLRMDSWRYLTESLTITTDDPKELL